MKRRTCMIALGAVALRPCHAIGRQSNVARIGLLKPASAAGFAKTTRLEALVVRKTARAPGLTVPQRVLLRAGRVIE